VVDTLRKAGVRLRSDVVIGVGGQQILIDDPSGNPVELFEPTPDEAHLGACPRYPSFSAARTLSHVFSTSVHAFLTAGSAAIHRSAADAAAVSPLAARTCSSTSSSSQSRSGAW
jgi:hypothetical protein